MRWSDERILTTHTGSLPRPPELTRLYVRRARGEAIDPAELDRVGKAALRRVVDKQIEAGVDIGNNGEQQREAFFLYVRHRMSGFGDSWQRCCCESFLLLIFLFVLLIERYVPAYSPGQSGEQRHGHGVIIYMIAMGWPAR